MKEEKMTIQEKLKLYESMLRIRKFEEKIIQLYAEGYIPGHVHLYIGEEPIASGICMHLKDEDWVFSSHRGHGHLLAKGADMGRILAEVFGKDWGYNHGKAGHMHICANDVRVYCDSIVGGGFGPAGGAALAQKLQKKGGVSVYFFGDGAANQGCMYEIMNMAALWDLPLILVLEDNKYAISTSTVTSTSKPGIAERAKAFGLVGEQIDGYDPIQVYEAGKRAVERARNGNGATLIACDTYRLRGHREGDPQSYRTREEVNKWREKDPLKTFPNILKKEGIIDSKKIEELEKKIEKEVEKAVNYALKSPYPSIKLATDNVISS